LGTDDDAAVYLFPWSIRFGDASLI